MRGAFYINNSGVYLSETGDFVGVVDEKGKFSSAEGLSVVPRAVYDSASHALYRDMLLEGRALLAAKRSNYVYPENHLDPPLVCEWEESSLVRNVRVAAIKLAGTIKWSWDTPQDFILWDSEVAPVIVSALDKVSAVCDLDFENSNNGNRIIIGASDTSLFDLVLRPLQCPFCMNLNMGEELNWGNPDNFHNLFLHSFLHFLGLEHSDDPNDIMYPNYRWNTPERSLGGGDVAAIQELYQG